MDDNLYRSILEEWTPAEAEILADLEYNKNLADHLVTTEVIYGKLKSYMNIIEIPDERLDSWQALGFSILSLQHSIYNIIPDFPLKQRGQLMALSNDVIKKERQHNDMVLSRSETLSESQLVEEIKSAHILVKTVAITKDKTLKIVLNNPDGETLASTALMFSRKIDAHGVNLKELKLYDAATATISEDIDGIEIFMKSL